MYLRVIIGSFVAMASAPVMSAEVTVTEEVRKVMVQLMQETQVAAVQGHGPASEYKSDGDPNTLEIVFLADKKDGSSHVTDDGEVIFLAPRTKDKVQQELIQQAFYLRALRKTSTSHGESPPQPTVSEKP
jgi:hypothetical protein